MEEARDLPSDCIMNADTGSSWLLSHLSLARVSVVFPLSLHLTVHLHIYPSVHSTIHVS